MKRTVNGMIFDGMIVGGGIVDGKFLELFIVDLM